MYEHDNMDELVPESWSVTDAGSACWAIQKIRERELQRDRYIQGCNATIERYSALAKQERENCDNSTQFFKDKLYDWFQNEPKRNLKASYAVDLPDGKLTLTKPKPDYIRDDAALLEYLEKAAPEYIKTTRSVNWSELKKAIADAGEVAVLLKSGEVIDGITVTETKPVFGVKY